MCKFKIGDKVVRMTSGSHLPIGHIGTVSYVSECGTGISLDGGDFIYTAGYFKLYKETPMTQETKVPHKHAAVIKAWADGAKIQVRWGKNWNDVVDNITSWCSSLEYRVKPEPKPDFIKYARVDKFSGYQYWCKSEQNIEANVIYTFDGETGKLKKAEVI